MNLWVIVPFHNSPDLLRACLRSIAGQDDVDLRVVIADDASDDDDAYRVYRPYGQREGWQWLRQDTNVGALQNIRRAIHHVQTTEDFPADDVILLVDGDDRLLPGAIDRIRAEFDGTDTLISWGSYIASPPDPNCPPARALPPDVLAYGLARAFTRDVGAWVNHPLAFRRRVYDVLRDDDFLLEDGTPIRHCYDTALSIPMLEAAGQRVAFIPDEIYVYRSDCADSVHRIHAEQANRENEWILSRPRKYLPIEEALCE